MARVRNYNIKKGAPLMIFNHWSAPFLTSSVQQISFTGK